MNGSIKDKIIKAELCKKVGLSGKGLTFPKILVCLKLKTMTSVVQVKTTL